MYVFTSLLWVACKRATSKLYHTQAHDQGFTTAYFGFDAIACDEVLQAFFNFLIPTTSNKDVLFVQYMQSCDVE